MRDRALPLCVSSSLCTRTNYVCEMIMTLVYCSNVYVRKYWKRKCIQLIRVGVASLKLSSFVSQANLCAIKLVACLRAAISNSTIKQEVYPWWLNDILMKLRKIWKNCVVFRQYCEYSVNPSIQFFVSWMIEWSILSPARGFAFPFFHSNFASILLFFIFLF